VGRLFARLEQLLQIFLLVYFLGISNQLVACMEFRSGTVVLLLFRGSENVGLIPLLCADLCADYSIINCVLQFHKVWCPKTRDRVTHGE